MASLVASPVAMSHLLTDARSFKSSTTAAAVAQGAPFQRRRVCVPRPRFSPGRVGVIFPREGFPGMPGPIFSINNSSNEQPQRTPPVGAEGEEGSASPGGPGEARQQTQSDAWGSNPWGSGDCSGPQQQQQQWQQWQQQQKQQWQNYRQKKWGQEECGPAQGQGAAYFDMLSPWFPSERSLRQMLGAADSMLGSMMGPAWAKWGPRQREQLQGLMSLALRRPWDVQETSSAYVLSFDLPGLSKEDVSVRVDNAGMLYIKAEREEEETGDSKRMARKFQTKLQLPEDMDKDGLAAEMKDGVLTITLPKKAPEEPQDDMVSVPIM